MTKRSRRVLWRAAWGASLALAVVILVLWLRSYVTFDRLEWIQSGGGGWHCDSGHGYIFMAWTPWQGLKTGQGWEHQSEPIQPSPVDPPFELNMPSILGISAGYGFYDPPDEYFLSFPYVYLMLLLLILPGMAVYIYMKRERRRDSHLCRTCGYDLRASADACPECGEPIPPTQESSP